MSTDPLQGYQALMNNVHAPAHLPDLVLEQARSQQSANEETTTARPATPASSAAATVPAPVFTVKRTRAKSFAIAACTVLALGLGSVALAMGPLAPTAQNATPLAASANSFYLAAYASEGGLPANGPLTLSSEDFFPARTSTGPYFDAETGSYPGPIATSRAYNLNLTCSGDNISSMTYELQGEGVSFNSWQLTSEDIAQGAESSTTALQTQQGSTFTVDYQQQGVGTAEDVHHEICLDYVLNSSEQEVWDNFYASTAQERVSRDGASADEQARYLEASNQLELVLAQHDANVISQAKLVLTATFADGSTATKTYRLTPVDSFEQTYAAYLEARVTLDGIAKPSYPALYVLEEVAG